MRRSRKPVYVQTYRGFESPPLRYEIRGICRCAGSFPGCTESVSWVMTRSDGGTAMGSTGAGRKGRLLGVLLMGPFMAQADATIANVATPSIHAELGATGAVLELGIGGYLIE